MHSEEFSATSEDDQTQAALNVSRRSFLQYATGTMLAGSLGMVGGGSAMAMGHSAGFADVLAATTADSSTGAVTLMDELASAASSSVWNFKSRPDLKPPRLTVPVRQTGLDAGFIFLSPKFGGGQEGAMIMTNTANPVLFIPKPSKVMDFKKQMYKGRPVLVYWTGEFLPGYGFGAYTILDQSYRTIATVEAGNGYKADLHELIITAQNTAIVAIYNKVPNYDLSPYGGPSGATVIEGIVQEIDIATGNVLFEWHSLPQVKPNESYIPMPKSSTDPPYDYFHINSMEVMGNGDLLVSARNTSAMYSISRATGAVKWRLGGKRSTFKMGTGTRTAYQHDARWYAGDIISVFDNAGAPFASLSTQSRGVVMKLDMTAKTATLVKQYVHPDKLRSPHQGNMQMLPNGNVLIGWGGLGVISEFSQSGALLYDARYPGTYESYRAFRAPWFGAPIGRPAIGVEFPSTSSARVYASWNGCTKVRTWRVLAGLSSTTLQAVGTGSFRYFETAMLVSTNKPYIAVEALGKYGNVLGRSRVVKRPS